MTATERGPLRVIGRYALYNEIAAGGMATVHVGRLLGPVGFARTVAIKRLHPQFAKDPEFVSMFLDEARLAARVQHPNVVATIDVVASEGEVFLIMDYVRGESLSKLVRIAKKDGVRIPPRIATAIMCGFLHGLHAAHEAKNERGQVINLVHRDVSPQNVLVGADGIPRVLDFGIAKAAGRIQVTRGGQIKGKLAYMPPEQLTGRDVTRAVDIYAAGVVLWEALTGERLFKGETESETLHKILRDPVIRPSAIVPDLPRTFDAPLLKALSRDISRRHKTARELAFELEKCITMASPSEVGEWVEGMVGPILSAREDEIAQIESNSTGIKVSPSGRPESDTSSHAVGNAIPSTAEGTLLGVGAPSGTMSLTRDAASIDVAVEDATKAKPTGSRLTGTMALPLDRRLPILASGFGLAVLLVIMAVVLSGRGSAARSPPSSALTAAMPSTTAPITAPLPLPVPAREPVEAPLAETAVPMALAPSASARVPTPPRPAGAAKPPPASAAPRKDCDPPYTLDPAGHRKYKLECM